MTLAPRPKRVPAPEPRTPEEELACLQRKLAKRENTPGFAANTADISARIAELNEALNDPGSGDGE